MFEQFTEYFWIALFAALVFYGLWQTVSAPFLVKRFYRDIAFEDQGRSLLDRPPYQPSVLLENLNAAHLYKGSYEGYRLEQFAAFPETRHKFTLSRVQRKRNQAMWTITLLHGGRELLPFSARPTNVTEAIEYVLKGGNVDFPDDEGFSKRVHVMADNQTAVRELLTPAVRDYLKNIDPVSIETVGSVLVHKSPRQPHDTGNKLRSDLDAVVGIYKELAPHQSTNTDAVTAQT